MIRVLIADDHMLVRTGVAQVLANRDDMVVVAAVETGADAIAAATELSPDVVLMDLEMPVMDGVEATKRIVALRPRTQVVMLTAFSDRRRILDALTAGAVGYLLKDAEPEDLAAGVRAAATGGSPLDPKAARLLLREHVTHVSAADLTVREREVLVLVARGFANGHIARTLGISEKTVKAHLTSVFRRLDVQDRAQAALWAERHGLLGGGPGP